MTNVGETTESSVQFRLAEIMKIENDRVARLTQEARGAELERERREHDRQEAEVARCRAAEQAARDAATGRALAHKTALQRIRIEVKAREDARLQEIVLKHEETLQRMRLDSGTDLGWRKLAVGIAVTIAVGGVVVLGSVRPALFATASVEGRGRSDDKTEGLVYKTRNAELRDDLARLKAISERIHAAAGSESPLTPTVEVSGRNQTIRRNPVGRPLARTVDRSPEASLEALDVDSTDPLTGL